MLLQPLIWLAHVSLRKWPHFWIAHIQGLYMNTSRSLYTCIWVYITANNSFAQHAHLVHLEMMIVFPPILWRNFIAILCVEFQFKMHKSVADLRMVYIFHDSGSCGGDGNSIFTSTPVENIVIFFRYSNLSEYIDNSYKVYSFRISINLLPTLGMCRN